MPDDDADDRPSARVALVGCSGMLGDIIRRAISDLAGIEVVADLDAEPPGRDGADPDGRLDGRDPLASLDVDLVLWNGADEARVSQYVTRAAARCLPQLLVTLGDGRNASLWQLHPQRLELGEPSPGMLADVVRRATVARVGTR